MNLRVAGLAVAALALAGCAAREDARPAQPEPQRSAVVAQPVDLHADCTRPAPVTAAGFTALFASLPPAQWGAADIALSVPLSDGRSVWLFGDTFSAGRFVHSTAITQTRGCLHVSHAGAQLLPNDPDTFRRISGHLATIHHIYWVTRAVAPSSRQLVVTARPTDLVPVWNPALKRFDYCVWCFQDRGTVRSANVALSPSGDLTFEGWRAGTTPETLNPGPMYYLGPHHFGYARHAHPEFRLSGGGVLVTTCQNWDDGVLHPLAAYRPIFSSSR